jgi:predicted Rossmann fold flavoprotein
MDGFPAPQARFLKPSLYRFPNSEVIRLIESNGLVTYVRDDGRVFPREGNAKDVLVIFERMLAAAGVAVLRGGPVSDLLAADGGVFGVRTENLDHHARTVVLTTGGVSYPRTGTTGDGHRWVARLGHTIIPLRPALAPIAILPPVPAEWRGVALRGGALSLLSNGLERDRWEGDMLFSHEGVTGPAALELSTAASEAMIAGGARLAYDFAPSKDPEGIDEDLQAEIQRHRGKSLRSIMDLRLPDRVVPAVLAAAGVDGSTKGYNFTRPQRRALGATLKRWDLGAVAGVDIARGEVTAGGVALGEVDPRTMRSRKVRGLYLAGEILDVAGRVGGYNLQAAFSTGFVAGEAAAREACATPGIPRAAVTDADRT